MKTLDFHLESRPCPKCGAAMLYDDGEPWDGPTWGCTGCGHSENAYRGMKVLMSMDPELLRRVVQAETEVELLRAALPVVQGASAIPIAWASSVGWRANQLMSAEQYRQCLPKNRADFDVPLYGPEALDNYRRQADENQQDAARFRMLLQQHKHWLGIFRCDPDGAPSDSLDHVELRALLDQLIAQERSA